jgi:adenosylcobinamide-GDP ribazoletransferase
MAPLYFPAEIAACLRFYSRLPMPAIGKEGEPHAMFDFARAAPAVPVAGAILGLCSALTLIAARALGLPPLVAALLTLAVSVAVTGGFHEDGLADCADSFGGYSRDEKLAIMKDSKIGAYGAVALVLSLGVRAAALAALLDRGLPAAAVALVAIGAVSRAFGLLPLALLAPARAGGAGSAAGKPRGLPLAMAVMLAVFLGYAPLFAGLGPLHVTIALLVAAAAAFAATGVAARTIGGQTGDVAGAVQQLAEIAYLCALVAAPRV